MFDLHNCETNTFRILVENHLKRVIMLWVLYETRINACNRYLLRIECPPKYRNRIRPTGPTNDAFDAFFYVKTRFLFFFSNSYYQSFPTTNPDFFSIFSKYRFARHRVSIHRKVKQLNSTRPRWQNDLPKTETTVRTRHIVRPATYLLGITSHVLWPSAGNSNSEGETVGETRGDEYSCAARVCYNIITCRDIRY